MVAAENDVFAGGKVGGIGDVVRDIPVALAEQDVGVEVVIPGYHVFSKLTEAKLVCSLDFEFAGNKEHMDVYKVSHADGHYNINQWVIEHPLFSACGIGEIYCNDPDHRPFASDATKFCLFNTAVATAIVNGVFGELDVIHLHDWHSAVIAVLREYDPAYQPLQSIKLVYTIHNLALQGIRPFDGDESSFKAWFPNLELDTSLIEDPRYLGCFNPMRAGINLSDKVHAVSENYANEIMLPSVPESGVFGGEGLEQDLLTAKEQGRLVGIINGCVYPEIKTKPATFKQLLKSIKTSGFLWLKNKPLSDQAHLIAMTRVEQLLNENRAKKPLLITSVGRLTDQKVSLLTQEHEPGLSVLEALLKHLGDKGYFILLGTGLSDLELWFTEVAREHANFIFIKGYSVALSDALYDSGDLFLMPSSFEPCGISQMLAMRSGQPCLANKVGGLADTIADDDNGFLFSGANNQQQADALLLRFKQVIALKENDAKTWRNISANAKKARFSWHDSAKKYIQDLYS